MGGIEVKIHPPLPAQLQSTESLCDSLALRRRPLALTSSVHDVLDNEGHTESSGKYIFQRENEYIFSDYVLIKFHSDQIPRSEM